MRKKQRILEHAQKQARSTYSLVIKSGLMVFFVGMLIANVFVFAQSVRLSDQIVKLETETMELRKENAQLQQEYYTRTSLTHLEALAKQLGFTEVAEPVSLESPSYALVP